MENENETNWESSDYTEEQIDNESSYDDLDSNDTDENYENAEQTEETSNERSEAGSDKFSMVVLLLIIIVLVAAGVFLAIKITGNKGDKTEPSVVKEVESSEILKKTEVNSEFFDTKNDENTSADMLGVGFSENGDVTVTDSTTSSDGVATVSEAQKNDTIKPDDIFDNGFDKNINDLQSADKNNTAQEQKGDINKGEANNSIVVAWNRASRQNPFKPPVVVKAHNDNFEKFGDVQFEIIEPPTKLVPDVNLTKLLQTQISGILYDDESPSAIVNLAGKDQFVKVGDEISGYTIKSITRNKVEISYKNNTYVASVGELFTPGKLEKQSEVANLSDKFAGRYKQEDIEE